MLRDKLEVDVLNNSEFKPALIEGHREPKEKKKNQIARLGTLPEDWERKINV
jgi:hypothetical protein